MPVHWNVPDSNCAQSEPNALADMQSRAIPNSELKRPFLDLGSLRLVPFDAVAGLEHPFIEPHLHPVRPQPLRQRAHHRLVLRAVAEENIVGEIVGHLFSQRFTA